MACHGMATDMETHLAVPRYGDAIRVAEAHEKSRRSHVNVDACIAETAHEK